MNIIKRKVIDFFDTTLQMCIDGNLKASSYGGFVLLMPFFILYIYWKAKEVEG